jgi:hypothetical protein
LFKNDICDLLEANRSLDDVAWYLQNSMLISTHIALNPGLLNFVKNDYMLVYNFYI